MSKVDRSKYGGGEGKLGPEDIDGDTAILVVTETSEVEFDNGMGLKIYSEESEEVPFIVSSGKDVDILIARLGEELDDWVGESIPIEVATRTFKGKEFVKLVVVPEADWDDVLGIVKPPRRKKTAKRKAAKKKTAKKRGRR